MSVLAPIFEARRRLSRQEYERRYNMNQLQRMEMALNSAGKSLRGSRSIFEFGCGGGRLISLMAEFAPDASLGGCDVLPGAVEACRRACPRGTFAVNAVKPPLALPDGGWDLIYSYSVFTHLSEPSHAAWLKELSRLLADGGCMVHTVHSAAALRRMAMFSPEMLPKYALGMPVEAFIRKGAGYHYAINEPSMPEYGLAVMTEEYVRAFWPRFSGLCVAAYFQAGIEAYPEGCQDIVVLTKESPS